MDKEGRRQEEGPGGGDTGGERGVEGAVGAARLVAVGVFRKDSFINVKYIGMVYTIFA